MLRPHQEKATEMLRQSMRRGNKNCVLAAPCSFGKTRVAVEILKAVAENGKLGIFICDRIKLVDQALAEFDRAGVRVGVLQADHWRSDPNAPIQIASIQTIARRRYKPLFHLAIIDECHTHYKATTELMESSRNSLFVGLSATPYSKGLGNFYSDLIVPITTQELLDQGYLCPVKYYGGIHANLNGVKTKRVSTGAVDYDPKSLSDAVEKDPSLVGAIIENFKRFGKGQTIAFSPSIKHSQKLVEMFREEGFSAEHIDGYMEPEERQELFEGHDNGDFQILSCSRLLNTGYDAPQVQTLIDCFSTKSKITFVQRAGRIMRKHASKEEAIYLDHSGNVQWHGWPESIVPESLHCGEKDYSEKQLTKEKVEGELSVCPQCYQHYMVRCICGYQRPSKKVLESDGQILKELKKTNREVSTEDKSRWLGDFQLYAKTKGYKQGWSAWAYKGKFGVWPNKIEAAQSREISADVKSHIIHMQIKRAKSAK